MNAIVLVGNKIDNIIVVESLDSLPNLVAYIDGANIGDIVENGVLIKQAKTISIEEAQAYLDSTDKYFTVDKYEQLSEERKIELTYEREKMRQVLRDAGL